MLTVLRIAWLDLRRDRLALVLTFVMPVLFFSVFATVFGSMDREGAAPMTVALVHAPGSALGERMREILERDPSVRLASRDEVPDVEEARRRIAAGRLTAAVVLDPAAVGRLEPAPPDVSSAAADVPNVVSLLVDTSNPIAERMLRGALRGAALQITLERLPPRLRAGAGMPEIRTEDVLGRGSRRPSVSFFAAGIGVMFLLFSAGGRSALLIEERETGVLNRLMASRLTPAGLLGGRWLFLSLLGFVQVSVMFVWGWALVGLDLWTSGHVSGFIVLTGVTAAAAAAFGLFLSVLCRTRAQLTGVSVVVVLAMSALGGSLFPRFLMPEGLQKAGYFTFNAWALDGYRKVFWYGRPIADIMVELVVLAGICGAFLGAASAWMAWRKPGK